MATPTAKPSTPNPKIAHITPERIARLNLIQYMISDLDSVGGAVIFPFLDAKILSSAYRDPIEMDRPLKNIKYKLLKKEETLKTLD